MQAAVKFVEYIIDTVSANHAVKPLLNLLKVNGKLVIDGLPEKPVQFAAPTVVMGKSSVPFCLVDKRYEQNYISIKLRVSKASTA